MSLQVPALTRRHATTNLQTNPGSAEGDRLRRQVLTAYANLPFKGMPLVVGNRTFAADMWRCSLEDELDLLAEDGLCALQRFDLEAWLMAKVDNEGTDVQKDELRKLRANLDEAEAIARSPYEIVDDGYGGLPSDISSVVHQPLTEIEVYRDISGIVMEPENGDDDDDDDGEARIMDFPATDPHVL